MACFETARAAADAGIERIEMGRDNLRYKAAFASGTFPVAAGTVAVGTTARLLRAGRHQVVRWSRSPYLATPTRIAKRMVNPIRGWLAFG
jgi:hypothetical protein